MPRIGVSYGVHTPETLRQYQPLAIADDVPSLQQYLLQYVDLKQVI
jgi:phosphoglycolate phosphatase